MTRHADRESVLLRRPPLFDYEAMQCRGHALAKRSVNDSANGLEAESPKTQSDAEVVLTTRQPRMALRRDEKRVISHQARTVPGRSPLRSVNSA